jgi:hypothetical protein
LTSEENTLVDIAITNIFDNRLIEALFMPMRARYEMGRLNFDCRSEQRILSSKVLQQTMSRMDAATEFRTATGDSHVRH